MVKYLAHNLGAALASVAAVVCLVFLLVNILPSDPARVRLGAHYNERDAAAIRAQYGLDRSIPEQFAIYVGRLATGDLGTSITTGEAVAQGLRDRLPQSLLLVALSLALSLPGAAIGVRGAMSRSRGFGTVETFLLALSVIPVFVLGATAIFLAARWGTSLVARGSGVAALQFYFLPALLLAFYPAFVLFKVSRDTLGHALAGPYVMAYRAFGFSEAGVVIWALRAVGVSLLGVSTNLAGYYLSSIYAVEFIFSLGGIGGWAVGAAQNYDIPVVLAMVVVSAVVYNAVNLGTAIVAPCIDGRLLRG